MYLNTQGMIEALTGKNKAYIAKIAKQQEEKYGNVDIFSARIGWRDVTIHFGDYYIRFFLNDNNKTVDKTGNGQGSKYEKWLQKCAEELAEKYC